MEHPRTCAIKQKRSSREHVALPLTPQKARREGGATRGYCFRETGLGIHINILPAILPGHGGVEGILRGNTLRLRHGPNGGGVLTGEGILRLD